MNFRELATLFLSKALPDKVILGDLFVVNTFTHLRNVYILYPLFIKQ